MSRLYDYRLPALLGIPADVFWLPLLTLGWWWLFLLLGATVIGDCCCGFGTFTLCECQFHNVFYGTVHSSGCSCMPNGTVVEFEPGSHGAWQAEHQTICGATNFYKFSLLIDCGAPCPDPGSCLGAEPPYVPDAWCIVGTCNDPFGAVFNECVLTGYTCTSMTFDVFGGDGANEGCWGSANCLWSIQITP